jgi:hypothetical protein
MLLLWHSNKSDMLSDLANSTVVVAVHLARSTFDSALAFYFDRGFRNPKLHSSLAQRQIYRWRCISVALNALRGLFFLNKCNVVKIF